MKPKRGQDRKLSSPAYCMALTASCVYDRASEADVSEMRPKNRLCLVIIFCTFENQRSGKMMGSWVPVSGQGLARHTTRAVNKGVHGLV